MLYMQVVFAPETKQDLRNLLNYIDTHASVIAKRRKNSEYLKEVNVVRSKLAASFAERAPGPGACRWQEIGVLSICDKIAEQFQVPIYDVVGDANPYLKFN